MMDFEEKVRDRFYLQNSLPYGPDSASRRAYQARELELRTAFDADFRAWLLQNCVPERYVDRVAAAAWMDGHAYGYTEVVACSHKFIDIFQGD